MSQEMEGTPIDKLANNQQLSSLSYMLETFRSTNASGSLSKQSAERQVVDHGRTVHFEVQGSLPPSENHVNPLTIIGKKKLQEHLYFPNAVHCTWNPLIAWQSHLIPAKSSLHPSICF